MTNASSARPSHRQDLHKEAYTMSLSVAICLLAAVLAVPEGGDAHAHVFPII